MRRRVATAEPSLPSLRRQAGARRQAATRGACVGLAALLLVLARAALPAGWREVVLPASFKRLSSLAMFSPENGWAGGRDGLVLRWNGTAWNRVDASISGDVVALHFRSPTEGWIASYDIGAQQSYLYRYDGRTWSSLPVPLGMRVTAATVDASGRAWLFGQDGRIVRYAGATWEETPSPGYRILHGAAASPDGGIWAVGEFGSVWRWDGTRWTESRTGVEAHLNSVTVTDSGDIWAVGDGGLILRRQRGRWQHIPSGTRAHLYSVCVVNSMDAWFGGADILLHWNGRTVTADGVSVHGELRALRVFPNGPGWAVGYGAVLRRFLAARERPRRPRLSFYREELLPNVLGVRGVAFGDVNGDGADDLYLVSLRDANHLLMNDGRGQFADVTGQAGLMGTVATSRRLQQVAQHGAAWGDIDNDGKLDLAVAGWHGSTALYRQASHGVFVDITDRLPYDEGPLSANAAVFADVDGDGWLDLFMTNEHGSNRLWLNDRRGGWKDVTARWGLSSRGGSKQAAFGDLDDDGDQDLYVCNWRGRNGVYRNDGGRFTDISATCAAAGAAAQSNGVTLADLDDDGDLDIVVTSSSGRNDIWRNDGGWRFTDVSGIVGFASGPFSYGSTTADFDQDGDLDLIIVNDEGINYFQNVGGLEFIPTAVDGMTDVKDADAVAAADMDGDGDIDVFVGSRADLVDQVADFRQCRSSCFINKLDRANSIIVRLDGVYSNRNGIGGRVTLWLLGEEEGERTLVGMREISAGNGYLSQQSAAAHFGVDTTARYLVRVRFPSGRVVEVPEVRAGARLVVREDDGPPAWAFRLGRRAWNWLWSDLVERHIWPLAIVIPILIWGIRTVSQRLLWTPFWTAGYTLALCTIYGLLAVATASAGGWVGRLAPPLVLSAMVAASAAVARWSWPRLAERLAYHRQMEALAARGDLTNVLSASTEPGDIAKVALREFVSLFPIEDAALCLCSSRSDRVEAIYPEGAWPDLRVGDPLPERFRLPPAEGHVTWDLTSDGRPDEREGASICLPLFARQTLVGAIRGHVSQRHVARMAEAEATLHGFGVLLAMSLHNAQLQQQARRRDAEYRAWLDAQATHVTPAPSVTDAYRELLRYLGVVKRRPPGPPGRVESLVAASRAMEEVIQRLRQVAPTDMNVLLLGESGTGKELAARAIHGESKRSAGPFVAVNCGAIPEGLLESELFGHTRGAFTGAQSARTGVFQRADGGTIFLDEIGEMDLAAQVRLLRVLQERTIIPVGGEEDIPVDVRVIAATHRDLGAAVAEGLFREDLYYRLNVFPVYLPPLRERMTDLPALVAILLHRMAERTGAPVVGVTEDAMARLLAYHWPGNIRELENCLERGALISEGAPIRAEHLQFERLRPQPSRPGGEQGASLAGRTLADLERELIEQTLHACDNNVSEAARRLDITRDILRYRMKKYGIRRGDGDGR